MKKNLLEDLRHLFNTYKVRGTFANNASWMVWGTALSLAIPLLAQPVLTRLYVAKAFGVVTLILSLSSVLEPLATLRYEHATLIVPNDRLAHILARACLMILSVFLIILFSAYLFGFEELLIRFEIEPSDIHLSWELGVYLASNSIINLAALIMIRRQNFLLLAKTRIAQAAGVVVLSLILGFFWSESRGLTYGLIVPTALVSLALLFSEILGPHSKENKNITFDETVETLARFKNFPLYHVPSNFFNALTNQIPVFAITALFGLEAAGFYGLTQKIMGAPTYLISKSAMETFRERAARELRAHGACDELFIRTFRFLATLSLIPFLILLFLAPSGFALIFGEEWRTSGQMAQILAPMYYFRFFSSPLSYVLILTEKQSWDLLWQIVLLAGALLIFFFNPSSEGLFGSLRHFSIFYSIMYLFYLYLSYTASKDKKLVQERSSAPL